MADGGFGIVEAERIAVAVGAVAAQDACRYVHAVRGVEATELGPSDDLVNRIDGVAQVVLGIVAERGELSDVARGDLDRLGLAVLFQDIPERLDAPLLAAGLEETNPTLMALTDAEQMTVLNLLRAVVLERPAGILRLGVGLEVLLAENDLRLGDALGLLEREVSRSFANPAELVPVDLVPVLSENAAREFL